ncbi:unnamed protein product [Triticum aestivum]|uniref:RNase H type-1 domain-containing protein n=1 Tax=Triticum aestivum TaxID=4565 RepID=A0A7H4LHR7_WHEAT|nr:unnamed protein product [Triticum aestivum]
MCYGVYFAAKKLNPYFQEHPITVVCTAPLAEIIGSQDASGRVAKWAIALAPYTIFYQPRTAINSQALADFLVDWAETQYLPPAPDSTHWRMHFDGSKMRTGLGGDKLKYMLQIHFAASNNVAEYEALVHGLRLAKELGIRRILCYGDSDLVAQQSSGDWDAKDANMASYRFLVQQISGYFKGCEFLHVLRADNDQADALARIGSTRQAIPTGVSLQRLLKPSIKPSPESDSIFVPPAPDTAGSYWRNPIGGTGTSTTGPGTAVVAPGPGTSEPSPGTAAVGPGTPTTQEAVADSNPTPPNPPT